MSLTKEERLKKREFYLKDDTLIINMPEIELQGCIKDDTAHNRYYLTLFKGTAGKPYINYYYRTKERRNDALEQAINDRKANMEYKAKRKAENKGQLTGAAATAKAIKARLKKEFPGIKFSVTSSNFPIGNSVEISWTDGPMQEQVEKITRQYQYGHFDGMEDYYKYRDINPELGCPGAKYVSCNRKLSLEYKAKINEILERDFAPYKNGDYTPSNIETPKKSY